MRNLRITFWGVQGSCPTCPSAAELEEVARQAAMRIANGRTQSESLPAPVPFPPFYGGDTSCVEVETADGQIILFDLGTGVRACSHHLLGRTADNADRTVHVFGSHQHIDHRMGTSFASFCFARPNPFSVHLYGNYEFLQSLEERYGLFSHHVTSSMHRDDPIDVDMMSADFRGVELVPESKSEPVGRGNLLGVRTHFGPVRIGSVQVTPFEVYHGPTQCLGYKLTRNGTSFVYCTDHEQRHGDASDPRQVESELREAELVRQCKGVDLAYFDGQYQLDEYLGLRRIGESPPLSRVDWGHSCIEDVVARARECQIRQTLIGHHDPARTWAQLWEIDRSLAAPGGGGSNTVRLARSGLVIDL